MIQLTLHVKIKTNKIIQETDLKSMNCFTYQYKGYVILNLVVTLQNLQQQCLDYNQS